MQATVRWLHSHLKLCKGPSLSKLEILVQRHDIEPPVMFHVNGEEIKQVTSSKYLGSVFSDICNVDEEMRVYSRISKASSAYGRLRSHVFSNDNLRLDTKISVYTAVCIITLLYGAETWRAYRKPH